MMIIYLMLWLYLVALVLVGVIGSTYLLLHKRGSRSEWPDDLIFE